ncbi:phosphate ABC transporter substrate-binding protein PstS [Acrocarpospora sp. B8E8]|uniref:phosphate ABC transporter substrate-binding protein PstS n=1 Tax=Acrocarpospora sp. B8E8 TaxID=3153572 RepID=UPI00325DD195
MSRVAISLLMVLVFLGIGPAPASGADLPTVNGAGSTFAYLAIQQWTVDVRRQGLSINYQQVGSTAGRDRFAKRENADFASSDVSYRFPDNLGTEALPNFPYTYMPLVGGGTAVMYSIKDNAGQAITGLKLSGPLLVKIFTSAYYTQYRGEPEMFWDDPDIKAENPEIQARLPHQPIYPVVRKGGSGTTSVFTEYLSKQAGDRWKGYMEGGCTRAEGCPGLPPASKVEDCQGAICGATDEWPENRGSGMEYKSGSDTVAITVQQGQAGKGAIGYAEYAYAIQVGLPVVKLKNASGNYAEPTACSQAIALTAAHRKSDGTYDLTDVYAHTHPNAYPISSYNYIIVPTDGYDAAKGEVISKFTLHAITEGQKNVDQIGYSQLPQELIEQGLSALNSVPGHPALPTSGAQWGAYYKSLSLPDGKKCYEEGEKAIEENPPNNNNNNNQNNEQNNNNNNNQNNNNNNSNNNNNNSNSPSPSASPSPGASNPSGGGGGSSASPSNSPKSGGKSNPTGGSSKSATGGPGSSTPGAGDGGGDGETGGPGSGTPTGGDTSTTTGTGDGTTPGVSPDGQVLPLAGSSGTSGGNASINPQLAGGAATEVKKVAEAASTPWTLLAMVLALIAVVFGPAVAGMAARLRRSRQH